jgi:atrial natriuretic peptide receptor A
MKVKLNLIYITIIELLLLNGLTSYVVREITNNLLSHVNFTTKDKIRIAVLGPTDENTPYSLNKIMPAILYAVRTIEEDVKSGKKVFLGGWENDVEVLYRNTQCSSTFGPLAAFDFYTTSAADIFLGPLCPYVLAPVARYSSIWEIPVLTTGGQEESFDHKQPHYRSLTRMNGSFLQVGLIFVQVFLYFDSLF